jgi:Tol biopolymer transport system component/tRNA A-37 threonylcarbamoyl transferase component Bud32
MMECPRVPRLRLAERFASLQAALADRYAIERELGAGGMATVYLAQDLKHHRQVAVKVLRPELAASLGRERFFREIEVAARLQHPHILPLHDSGESDGFLYYVMPYVEGESLRQRLARKGEMPVSDAVRTLTEVVDALAYAHSRGVVHRDLKPDNIMISGRQPLVMDFGIAKAVSVATGSENLSTGGLALGTPAYMAPEQAVGDPQMDHRVDIYAVGAMGYELLTGSPPFTGMSSQQVLAAQVTEAPVPILTRRPAVPTALAAVLMQCLEKRPADRPQSAEELLHVLESVATPGGGLTPTGLKAALGSRSSPSRRTRALLIGAAILGAVTIGLLLWRGRASTSDAAGVRHTQLTYTGTASGAQISPDGQLLAYVEFGDTTRLLVRDLTGGSVIPIAMLHDIATLRWSPDGASLLLVEYDSNGRFNTVLFPRLGGAPRPLSVYQPYAVLSPNETQIAGWREPIEDSITLTAVATGVTRKISVPDSLGWHFGGDWSPDGHSIALLTVRASGNRWMLSVVDVETGKWHKLLEDTVSLTEPRWSSGGDALYYLRGKDEVRKLHIASDGLPRGAPEILQTGFGADGSGISITLDGRRLVYTKTESHSNLWIATWSRELHQFATTQLTRSTAAKAGGRLSPDGQLVAFVQYEQDRGDVYVLPIKGGTPNRVTSSGIATSTPVWSPDGQRLAFIGTVGGVAKVRTISLDGRGERTYERTLGAGALAWAPQERILYQAPGNRNFYWVDLATEVEEPLVSNDSVGWMSDPSLSPDGRYVAVFWNRKPQFGVYLISGRDSSQRRVGPMTPWPFGLPLGWSSDGRFIYVSDSLNIRRVPATGGEGIIVATLPFKNVHNCILTERPSGLVLVCNVGESVSSDVWMMENFDPAISQSSR